MGISNCTPRIGNKMHRAIFGRVPAHAALIATVLALASCGHIQPIYNVEQHPIPPSAQRLTLKEIGQTIIQAATPRHWIAAEVAPGQISATYSAREHSAQIRILYAQTSYSIEFVSATNLDAQDGRIHHKYNEWIRDLDRDIAARLVTAGSGHA